MAGVRKKPIQPEMQALMNEHGLSGPAAFAKHYKIDERLAYQLADGEIDTDYLQKHLEAAEKLGISMKEYIKKFSAA